MSHHDFLSSSDRSNFLTILCHAFESCLKLDQKQALIGLIETTYPSLRVPLSDGGSFYRYFLIYYTVVRDE